MLPIAIMLACTLTISCSSGETSSTLPAADVLVPLSGKRPQAMRNCPTAVPGAVVQTERTREGIDLTITAERDSAQAEIVSRMRQTLATRQRDDAPHSGRGGGPELIGYCPVILVGAIVTYDALPTGVRVHMKASDPLEVGVVQARVESRLRALRPRTSRASSE